MANILIVIAEEGYQDKELSDTKQELEGRGHNTFLASTALTAKGKLGGSEIVNLLLNNAEENDYDALVFIGGPGTEQYFTDKKALSLAQKFNEKGKLIGAICAAPSILANAGLLKNKTCTAFPSEKENIEKNGGRFTGAPVEKDNNIITGNGPEAAKAFGKAIAINL